MASGTLSNGDSQWIALENTLGSCIYLKRNGIVTVVGQNLTIPTGNYQVLGTLPTGYRTGTQVVGQLVYTDEARVCGYFSIGSNGQIIISNRLGSDMVHCYFVVSFPALG